MLSLTFRKLRWCLHRRYSTRHGCVAVTQWPIKPAGRDTVSLVVVSKTDVRARPRVALLHVSSSRPLKPEHVSEYNEIYGFGQSRGVLRVDTIVPRCAYCFTSIIQPQCTRYNKRLHAKCGYAPLACKRWRVACLVTGTIGFQHLKEFFRALSRDRVSQSREKIFEFSLQIWKFLNPDRNCVHQQYYSTLVNVAINVYILRFLRVNSRVLLERFDLTCETGSSSELFAFLAITQINKLDAEISSGGGSGRRGVSPTPLNSINVSL